MDKKHEKILLISGSSESVSEIKGLLQDYDYLIMPLDSTDKIAQVMKDSDIEMVIADIGNSGEDISQTAEHIWDIKRIPLLFLVTGRVEELSIEVSPQGICDFLGKPVAAEALLKKTIQLTCRSRYEKKILESQKRYRDLYDNAPDMYFTIEPGGKITSVNLFGATYLGYRQDELIGRPVWNVVFEDDIQSVKERISDVFHRKLDKAELEFRKITKDGQVIWVQERMQLIFDQEDNPVELRIICRDVTEKKEAQIEILEREKKYESILATLMDVYFELNPDGSILEISPSIVRLSSFEREELIGSTMLDLVSSPDENETFIDLIQRKGEIRDFEASFKAKSGEIHYCLINARLYSESGSEQNRVIGFLKDISYKKKLEEQQNATREQLKILFERAPDAIFIKDRELRYTAVNEAMENMFGISGDQVRGKNDLEIFGSELAEQMIQQDRKVLNGATVQSNETRRIDGVERTYNMIKVPLTDKKDHVIGLCGIARDLTSLKQAEAELQQRENALRTVLENSPDFIFYLDKMFNIRIMNRDCTEKKSTELLGSDFLDLISDQHRESTREILEKVLSNGKRINTEFVAAPCMGEKTFTAHVSPIFEEGVISGLVVTCTDVSEYKKSINLQNILYEITETVNTSKDLSEIFGQIKQILSRILDTKNFFIALYNRDNDTITLPYFVDEFDSFKTFPAGKTLTSRVIKSGTPLLATRKKIDEMVAGGEVETIGTTCKVWMGVPLKIKSEIIGVVTLQSYESDSAFTESDLNLLEYVSDNVALAIERKRASDELKISRRNFRAISDTIEDAFWIRDHDSGRLIFSNRAFELIFELETNSSIDSNMILDLIHPEDREEVIRAYAEKEENFEFEYRLLLAGNRIKWLHEKFYRVSENEGEPGKLIGITRDITASKKIAAELEENRETLKLINTILRHDLTNDLSVISSALRLHANSDDRKYLEEIENSVMKSKTLITRMSELEKTLERENKFEMYDLESILAHILKNYPEVESKIKGNCQVKADKAIISIFDNIIQNAVNHGMTKSIAIRIESGKDYCQVEIADRGTGIPAEVKPKIFQKRYSYGKSGKTGIGLYIVKKNLARYGAEIRVEDNQPRGTVFIIRFHNI